VPQLAACVWIGYPKGEISLVNVEGLAAVFGGSLPAEIWNRFMSYAVANLPVESFPTPVITGHTISAPYSYSSPSSSSGSSSGYSQSYSPPASTPAPAPAPKPQPKPRPKPSPPVKPPPTPGAPGQ
jgi:membrane peptidoglycan carboxypeptidase